MMNPFMPSPIGHVLAGLAVGWSSEPPHGGSPPGRVSARPAVTPLALACAALAALPDADLLIPAAHRTATHSVTGALVVLIVAAAVTRQVTGRSHWRVALVLALAQLTHVALDWLGADPFPPAGIQAFWPFDDRFYISPITVFPGVERNFSKPEVISANLYAAVVELLLMGPVAWAAWTARCRRARRGSPPDQA